ncbi:MAG: hypothetical protein JWP74_2413 [Marmoricola sp.]|nr:hypothetical protein [Marmoricola sp.]
MPASGPVRVVTAIVAAGALAGSVVFTLLWLLHPDSYWFVLFTSFIPLATLLAPLAAVLLAVLRRRTEQALKRWVTGAIALVLAATGFQAFVIGPLYLGSHSSGPVDLTVLCLNLRLGHGDATQTVALVRREKPQVASFEEVTPAELQRLIAAGIRSTLPYSAGSPGAGSAGTVVFSSYPLSAGVPVPLRHHSYAIRVQAPRPFWLVAVHMAQPLDAPGEWRAGWGVLNDLLPTLKGPVVVAGDFNTTVFHGPMRQLLGNGFSDAARTANSGWQPTWPSGSLLLPGMPSGLGLMAIDHVITNGSFKAVSTDAYDVDGSDHRALVARLAR